jgi:hypothetical protein
MKDIYLTKIQKLSSTLDSRKNFEFEIFKCSDISRHRELFEFMKRKMNYSAKILRNIDIWFNCDAFEKKFTALLGELHLDIFNRIDTKNNKEDKRNYIIEQMLKLDSIISSAKKIQNTYDKKTLISEGIFIDKGYEYIRKIRQYEYIHPRTKDDDIENKAKLHIKMKENYNLIDDMMPDFEKINEDIFYISQISYCIKGIINLQKTIVNENFNETELNKIIELKEFEGRDLVHYNFEKLELHPSNRSKKQKYTQKQLAIACYLLKIIIITKEEALVLLKKYTKTRSVAKFLQKRVIHSSELTCLKGNKTADTKHRNDLLAAKRLVSGEKDQKAKDEINQIITAFQTSYDSEY